MDLTEHSFYYTQIKKYTEIQEKAARKVFILGSLRLAVFLSVFFLWFFLIGTSLIWWITVMGITSFLYLVHLSADARYEKVRAEKMVQINENELQARDGDWSCFKDGSSYQNPAHPFSSDMDLFGPKSLFQLVNRTVSKKGERLLALQLSEGTTDVALTSAAIRELSHETDWAQSVLAEGMVFLDSDGELVLKELAHYPVNMTKVERVLIYLIPFISFVSIGLWLTDLINGVLFSVVLALVLALVMRQVKRTNRICLSVGRYDRLVSAYERQVELVDAIAFKSPEMQHWKDVHFGRQGDIARALTQLAKIQKHMDYRLNLVAAFVLNILFAWDFRVLQEWSKWHVENASKLEDLENTLAQLEVWISGASYLNHHPSSIFATFSTQGEIDIQGLGHPFISEKTQVRNDLQFTSGERFYIVTGPNMAGKSTYLRSVGWAFISANAGFPVLATHCEIPSLQLYTSMRTADDLTEKSSFFHAELKRLRFIVDAIERGEEVFVILDEILKGTNSKDKEEGSAGLLRKLAKLKATGIIATHDLSLCSLAEESTDFRNRYFDSTIDKEELQFDYRIRDGVCQNMNASFLLKKMGLV
jgi:hypothetical protein